MLGQVNSADRFKLTADVDEFYLGHVIAGPAGPLFTIDGRDYRAKVAKVYPQVTQRHLQGRIFISTAPRPPASMSARRST